jgi:hypothetical protein
MKSFLTTTTLATAFILGTLGASSAVAQDAQPPAKECVGDQCPDGAMGGKREAVPEQAVPRKRLKAPEDYDQMQGKRKMPQGNQAEDQKNDQVMPRKKRVQSGQQDDDVDVRSRVRVGEGKWRFDPNRHERRRSKSATFRFYFGGYWYPQPYWDVYSVGPRYRISCGEGRGIVAERFNRVRVVECNGGTYTYLGRRSGDTYRILLNARTGRIVGRTLI